MNQKTDMSKNKKRPWRSHLRLKIELFLHCVMYVTDTIIFSVFVDTDGTGCVTASFVFGGGSDSRQYDIRVR